MQSKGIVIPYTLDGERIYLAVDGNGRATLALHFKNFINELSDMSPESLVEEVIAGRIHKSLVDAQGNWTYKKLELEMYVISRSEFMALDKPKLFRVLTFINMDTRATTSGMSGYLYDIMNYVTSRTLGQAGRREPTKVQLTLCLAVLEWVVPTHDVKLLWFGFRFDVFAHLKVLYALFAHIIFCLAPTNLS